MDNHGFVNASNIKLVQPIERKWLEVWMPESIRISPETERALIAYIKRIEKEVIRRVNEAHDAPVAVLMEPTDIDGLVSKVHASLNNLQEEIGNIVARSAGFTDLMANLHEGGFEIVKSKVKPEEIREDLKSTVKPTFAASIPHDYNPMS